MDVSSNKMFFEFTNGVKYAVGNSAPTSKKCLKGLELGFCDVLVEKIEEKYTTSYNQNNDGDRHGGYYYKYEETNTFLGKMSFDFVDMKIKAHSAVDIDKDYVYPISSDTDKDGTITVENAYSTFK